MQRPSHLVDVATLRALESGIAGQLGDPFEPMRRAGAAAWRELLRHWPHAQRIVVVCGPGNNGGDGYVLARHALGAGRAVHVISLAGRAPAQPLAARALAEFQAMNGTGAEFDGRLPQADVVVDALFGIGLSRAPDPAVSELIRQINEARSPVLSLDIPSGLDADLGSAPGACVQAQCTIEFIARKRGLSTGAALGCAGSLALADLGVDGKWLDSAPVAAERLLAADLARWLRPRARGAHKGDHGRVLCVGGDHGGGGAIMLCAQAALRSGAGLVDVATRELHVPALLARLPEAMAHVPTHREQFDTSIAQADVIAIGPGLGKHAWGQACLDTVLEAAKPLVADADALNLLSAGDVRLPSDSIVTPHPGEAARLLGIATARVQRDRYGAAQALVERLGCVVVLKGAGTIVAAPDEVPRVIGAGNPGMAVGGMGDVLTGVIAALRAQRLSSFDAASAGALLHAAAGDLAARDGERGLLPTDLMTHLRRLVNPDVSA